MVFLDLDDVFTATIVSIFKSTSYEYGMSGVTGFNYHHLKDNIKWHGLKPSKYTNLLYSMLNNFMRGQSNSK